MPAARYWRIVGVETYAGGDLELSELHLYGASGRLDAVATLASTIAPTAGTLAALQDDNLGTACRFAGAAVRSGGFAFVWDFGAGNTADAIGLRLGAAAQNLFMAGCSLQYSTDGAQWWLHATFNRYIWPGGGVYTPAIVLDDPHIDKVALLLHMDGVDGSTTFNDRSPTAKAIAASGNAKVSAAQSKWGGASLVLDGSGDYLSAPAHADFVFGVGDFTVELWINTTTAAEKVLVDQFESGNANSWQLSVENGRLLWYSGGYVLTGAAAVNNGAWHHVAAVRSAGTLRFFVDGVLDGSVALGRNFNTNLVLGIGAQVGARNSAYDFPGYIDELRITKGVGRYTANFAPPTGPFPDSTGGNFFLPATMHTAGSAAQLAASSPVPAFSTRRAHSLQMARDIEHGGPGTIYGTTKTKGASANTPTYARVVLLHQRSKLPVREVWSDPITGSFAFTGIDATQQFITLVEDAAGDFRPVAASRLVPEVAP